MGLYCDACRIWHNWLPRLIWYASVPSPYSNPFPAYKTCMGATGRFVISAFVSVREGADSGVLQASVLSC